MPEEIVEKILKLMRPNDLIGISGTSKRYKDLVEDLFSRKFSMFGKIVIGPNFQGDVGFQNNSMKKYEKHFRALIKNVKVNFCNRFAPIDVESTFHFIAANCSNDIRSLELHSRERSPIHILERHFSIIKDKIIHLEQLALEFDIILFIPKTDDLLFTFSDFQLLLEKLPTGGEMHIHIVGLWLLI